ncbi:MAG TPA: hypothetical protein VMR45_04470 [Patescibacteria group bacterium]|nr:hypothetical protein [Patescibacteria group bacterium]
MRQIHELLNRKMTRKQFLGVLGIGLASLFGAGSLAKKALGDSAPIDGQAAQAVSTTANYGAWRPRASHIPESNQV